MERGDGRFLAAMLGARAGEHAADLADERALHPETPGLVQEVAHLCAHVAEARGRSEDDGVVGREFVYATNGSGLVQLHFIAGSALATVGLSGIEAHGPARWVLVASGICGLA